jgi:hypothetical protein
MASFNIDIPIRNIDAEDVKEAFASSYGYQDRIQVGGIFVNNPISKEQFVQQKCINFILDILSSSLIKNEENTAKEIAKTIVSQRAADVTQWFDDRRLESIGGLESFQKFPIAESLQLTSLTNKPVSFTLTGTDPDNLPLTFIFTKNPSNGIISGESPNFTYTPNLNYSGNENLKFKANNGSKNSLEANLDITIEQSIYVNDLNLTLRKNQNKLIALAAFNFEGQLNFEIIEQPENGSLTGSDPLNYLPLEDFIGTDSFKFKATDDVNESNVGTVNLDIVDLIVFSENYTTSQDIAFQIQFAVANSEGNLNYEIVSGPVHGQLSSITNDTLTYTPNENYVGNDNFTFRASDDYGSSNLGTITIEVFASE